KNIGKPYAGKPHVRFDEEGLVIPALYSTIFTIIVRMRQMDEFRRYKPLLFPGSGVEVVI
ncbi:hypothetical protein, partial [Paenibacillus oceani]|uniref:hypothetical protein n=1 Tax=Paenibacillus oceani TaxID=2772510 RepID=UPI001CC2435C